MMRRTFCYTIATAGLLALCVAGRVSKSAADPITQLDFGPAAGATAQSQEEIDALTRFKERDFDGALKLLREAVKKNADLPPAQVLMAQLFSRVNDPIGPIGMRNALERAVIEAPTDPEAYVDLGQLALRERRVTEAKLVYQEADNLMAKFDKSAKRKETLRPLIFSGLAAVAEAREDWAGAQKQLEAWLKLDSKNAEALQRLARCLFQQKNASGALEKLREAVKAEPTVLTPEAYLGQWYEQANDRENAKKWMAAALKAAPKDIKTRLAASHWALQTGQLDQAQAEAETALQIDKNSLEAKILRGAIALYQKDYPTAERYSLDALVQSPRDPRAINNLALALVEQKDRAKKGRALDYAITNSEQNPKNPEVASTGGWILYRNGKLEEADRVLQAVIAGGQFGPDTAYYAAKVDVERDREAQARQLLEAALKTTGPFAMRQEAKALLEDLKLKK